MSEGVRWDWLLLLPEEGSDWAVGKLCHHGPKGRSVRMAVLSGSKNCH